MNLFLYLVALALLSTSCDAARVFYSRPVLQPSPLNVGLSRSSADGDPSPPPFQSLAEEQASAKEKVAARGFPKQDWTYSDVNNPPEWLVPKQSQKPGVPISKPPPVPPMLPPPPPVPFPGFRGARYPTQVHPWGPPAPTYILPEAPPQAMSSWIPINAFVPDRV